MSDTEFKRLLLNFEIAYSEHEPVYHPDTERRYHAANAALTAHVHALEERIAAQDEQINALQQRVHLCAGYDKLEALLPLAKYGRELLTIHREYLDDIGGGEAQDAAVRLGLLSETEAIESCGERCRCVDYDAFPQMCMRETPAAKALDAAIGESDGWD